MAALRRADGLQVLAGLRQVLGLVPAREVVTPLRKAVTLRDPWRQQMPEPGLVATLLDQSSVPFFGSPVTDAPRAGVDPDTSAADVPASAKLDDPEVQHDTEPTSLPRYHQAVEQAATREQRRMHRSRQRHVPESGLARAAAFGGLFLRLGAGGVAETLRRVTGSSEAPVSMAESPLGSYSAFLNEANAERLVDSLSRMRGAALKVGQLLSIQDDALLPPFFLQVLERVRDAADEMPRQQLEHVLASELGADWADEFEEFSWKPIAAASIGQVHRARLRGGEEVAMKIQYPGVAKSIQSDVANMARILKMTGVGAGFHLDAAVDAARSELLLECDYVNEASNYVRMANLLESSGIRLFTVPQVIHPLTTTRVLTTQYVHGVSIGELLDAPQDVRNAVASGVLGLALRELFEWRFMQTDPNWSNFLYDGDRGVINMVDFGACQEYPARFSDLYLEAIMQSAAQNHQECERVSIELGFLLPEDSRTMRQAHTTAMTIVGEPFSSDEPFDFGQQNTTQRITALIPTMLQHRLSPPPREVYALHRRLAGSFLLAAKLRAKFSPRQQLRAVLRRVRPDLLEVLDQAGSRARR